MPTSYQMILKDIEDQILSGELAEGSVLPLGRQLAERYGVSEATIDRAMGMLRQLGWIVGHQGKERRVAGGAKSAIAAWRRHRGGPSFGSHDGHLP